LTAELANLGASLLIDVLTALASHPPVDQPEDGVTYAAKIDKAESRIDFTQSAEQVERQIRAFAPAPGAFFEHQGERIRILAADVAEGCGDPGTIIDTHMTIACGSGAIHPVRVQRAGKSAMSTDELLRGYALPSGTQLS
jgi:methionyl-tRNA formyltransferase